MTNSSVFSPKLLIGFVAVAVCGFIVSLYLSSSGRLSISSIGPTTYSRSSVGYNGLAELLSSLEIPVVKSQKNSAQKARNGLLILAEPVENFNWDVSFKMMLTAPKVLVVLPKWYGFRSQTSSGWIEKALLQSSGNAQTVLNAIMKDAEFVRADNKIDFWTRNSFSRTPIIPQPVQLVKSKSLDPLIATDAGILLGEYHVGKHSIWVLSDPDILSNHGLGMDGKRNAVLAVEVINKLRGDGPVVFDESIHGFMSQAEAPWRMLFQFPYIIVTGMVLVAIALLLWATVGRFGTHEREKPALEAGKHGLIGNVAELMGYAGYQKFMMRRYTDAIMREVGRQLRAPKRLSHQELAAWLTEIGKTRGVSLNIQDLLARADDLMQGRGRESSSSASVAKDIYRWKGEMLNGPAGHSRDH